MRRRFIKSLPFIGLFFWLSAVSQAQEAFMQKAINLPAADQWNVYGAGETHALVKDATVKGGWALTVDVTGAGANPWDVQAGVSTLKPIKKGDVMLLAFWARSVTPPEGATVISIPANMQMGHTPYTRIGEQTLDIGSEWKLYYVSGTAPVDLAAGEASGGVQLATGKQSIALGPIFMLDFGPDYDLSRLPHN